MTGPLGTRASGEGVGSLTGEFIGDGTRILAWGVPGDAGGPPEYWLSSGGGSWTRLALNGSGAGAVADANNDGPYTPVLLRDGILFSAADLPATFGTPSAP